ncbi:hypothetical protein SAMD00079811_06170 [Scytonema sp. HK-05]|jgi:hypothetical protein|uniref:hypothetical protein n=1 Tax=Scytonema sp. HK-05 TaxID=1137095 RepID=UPI000936558B|nr:hypothetical protein [Scytonema sp. HK-05]OKH59882.1 hypothetical protein NIES2130_06940 [Scytonema sp. HK-05]BAY43039.1 hypothetical protein SAMD00079811_06170 [Scytonema sp. HK-05]
MKKTIIPYKIKGSVVTITILFGILSLFLTCLFAKIVRVKFVEIDFVLEKLEIQSKAQANNPRAIPRVDVQRRLGSDIRPDLRCLFWATTVVGRGWTNDSADRDFFIDYYIPPDKKAMICTTPALAAALIAKRTKPLLYKVYPTEYGFRVRIVEGLSKVRKPCKNWTGNVDCADSLLSRQAIIRYEP